MIRQLWTVLQWMKTSKRYKSWFQSIQQARSRVRKLFSGGRRIAPRKRTCFLTMEVLEVRQVPATFTSAPGGGDWSSPATWTPNTGAVPGAGDTVNIQSSVTITSETVAAKTLNIGTSTLAGTLTLSSGVLDMGGGSINIGNSASKTGTLILDSSSDIYMTGSGSWNAAFPGGSSSNSGTVYFDGTGAVPSHSPIFGNVVIDSSGNVNMGSGLTLTITGLTVESGTLNFGSTTNLNVSSVTIDGGAWNAGPSSAITISGDWTNNGGTFSPNGSTETFATSSTVSGMSSSTFNNVVVDPSSTVTLANNDTISGNLTVDSGGTLTANTGTTLTLSGSSKSIPGAGGTITLSNVAVTGSYTNSATLSLENLSGTGHLTESGSSFLDIAGNATISTLTATAAGNTVDYDGIGGVQTGKPTSYSNLVINNTSVGGADEVSMAGNTTVSDSLTLTSGNLATGANTLTVASGGSISRSTGYVIGNLEEYVPSGSPTVTFEVGTTNNTSSDYTPISVAFANVTGGYVIASASSGAPSLASSGLDTNHYVSVNWELANASGGNGITAGAGFSYSPTFDYESLDLIGGAVPSELVIGDHSGSSWTYPAVALATSYSVEASSITTSLSTVSSDFELAELPTGVTAWQQTDDPNNALQVPIGEATVLPGSGGVMISQPLDFDASGGNAGGATSLVYDSADVDSRPIIQAQAFTGPIPASISLSLTFDGPGSPQTSSASFTPTGSINETYELGVQVPNPVTTSGIYPWTLTETLDYSGGLSVTTTTTGLAVVVAEDSSPYGAGWSIAGVDQLLTTTIGGTEYVLWETGNGQARVYVQSSTSAGSTFFTNPEDFGTLVETSSGGNTFTYTAVDQTESIFTASSLSPTSDFLLTSVIDTGHSLTQSYTYNSSDRLTEVMNTDGSATNLSYGPGNSVVISEPEGNVTLNIDTDSNLTQIIDAAGYVDSMGMMTSVGSGFTRNMTYAEADSDPDSMNLLTSDSWDPYSTSFTYNSSDDLLSNVIESGSESWSISPAAGVGLTMSPTSANSNGLIATIVDPVTDTTTYAVDQRDRETFEQDPNSNTQSWNLSDSYSGVPSQYGPGLVLSYTDGMSHVTTYNYNSFGLVTEQIDPNLGTTYYEYGGPTDSMTGKTYNLVTETSQELTAGTFAVTTDSYNLSGDLTQEISPNSDTSSFSYSAGLMTSMTDAMGNVTVDSYSGRLLTLQLTYTGSSSGPGSTLVNEVSFSYDNAGNLIETLSGSGTAETTEVATYNGDGEQLTDQKYATAGTTVSTSTAFDAAGLVVTSITGTDTIAYTYDGAAQELTETDSVYPAAIASSTTNSYNLAEELITSIQGTDTTSYAYDSDGNATMVVTEIMGGIPATSTSNVYNADNLVVTTIQGTDTTVYGYDSDNNPTSQVESISSGLGPVVASSTSTVYDLADREIASINGSDTTSYVLDSDGNDVSEYQVIAMGTPAETVTNSYDSDDRLTMTMSGPETTSYTYDGAGDTLTVTTTGGGETMATTNSFNLDGQLVETIQGTETTYYTYDGAGDLLTQIASDTAIVDSQSFAYNSAGQQTLAIHGPDTSTFTYDADGRMLTETDYISGVGTASTTTDSYNEAGQLTQSIMGTETTDYTYDAAGDLLMQITTGAMIFTSSTFAYNQAGQQTLAINGTDTSAFTYDAAGNLLTQTDYVSEVGGNETASYLSNNYNEAGQLLTAVLGTDTTIYTYDAAGNVLTTTVSDSTAEAEFTSNSYDQAGNLVLTVQGTGTYADTSSFTYNGAGQVLTQVDYQYFDAASHIASSTSNSYDSAGMLVETIQGTETTYYTYDGAGDLLTQIASDTAIVDSQSFAYNSAGQQTLAIHGPDTSTFTYDADGRMLTETDYISGVGTASTTTDSYNEAGQLTQSIMGTETTDYTYDAAGDLLMQITTGAMIFTSSTFAYNQAGQQTLAINGTDTSAFTYDAAGNLLTQTDYVSEVGGNETASYLSNNYNEAGQLLTAVLGPDTTIYTYDAAGNVLTTTVSDSTAEAEFTSNSYDQAGNLVLTVQGTGTYADTSSFTYNGAGQVLTQVDYQYFDAASHIASSTSNSYDSAGMLVETINGPDTTYYAYNDAGELTSQTEYLGTAANVSTFSYNQAGQLLTSVNGDSDTTSYAYDADGDKTLEIDGFGSTPTSAIATTSYYYDQARNLTEEIDPSSNATYFSYNGAGELTGESQMLGTDASSFSYTYNEAGQLISTINENGQSASYTLDADGRTLAAVWSTSSGGSAYESFSYTYDEAGNMLTASNDTLTMGGASFTYTMSYNGANLVTSVTEPFGVSLTFGYNLAGQRTSVTDSFGGTETLWYDADGDLTMLSYNIASDSLTGDMSYDFAYNEANQQTAEMMYSSGNLIASVSTSYDGGGNATNITAKNAMGSIIDSFSYTYDSADWVQSESDTSGLSVNYTYDATGQLIGATTAGMTPNTYSLSAAGDANGTSDTVTAGNELTQLVEANPVGAGTITLDYTYDAAGNVMTKTQTMAGSATTLEWSYGYDFANHLTSVVETQTDTMAMTMTTLQSINYEYDPFGNIVVETEMGGGTLEYAVDGWNPAKAGAVGLSGFDTLAIINGSSGGVQTRNIYGNGIDQVLGRIDNSAALALDNGVYFTLTDKNGSVRDVLDSTPNDNPVDVVTYDAYGNIVSQTGPEANPCNYLGQYGYDGYDWDAAAGLDLVHARVYDPQSQRWLSQDPLGFDAGDSNLYRYVNNAPTNFSDPSGMDEEATTRFSQAYLLPSIPLAHVGSVTGRLDISGTVGPKWNNGQYTGAVFKGSYVMTYELVAPGTAFKFQWPPAPSVNPQVEFSFKAGVIFSGEAKGDLVAFLGPIAQNGVGVRIGDFKKTVTINVFTGAKAMYKLQPFLGAAREAGLYGQISFPLEVKDLTLDTSAKSEMGKAVATANLNLKKGSITFGPFQSGEVGIKYIGLDGEQKKVVLWSKGNDVAPQTWSWPIVPLTPTKVETRSSPPSAGNYPQSPPGFYPPPPPRFYPPPPPGFYPPPPPGFYPPPPPGFYPPPPPGFYPPPPPGFCPPPPGFCPPR